MRLAGDESVRPERSGRRPRGRRGPVGEPASTPALRAYAQRERGTPALFAPTLSANGELRRYSSLWDDSGAGRRKKRGRRMAVPVVATIAARAQSAAIFGFSHLRGGMRLAGDESVRPERSGRRPRSRRGPKGEPASTPALRAYAQRERGTPALF